MPHPRPPERRIAERDGEPGRGLSLLVKLARPFDMRLFAVDRNEALERPKTSVRPLFSP